MQFMSDTACQVVLLGYVGGTFLHSDLQVMPLLVRATLSSTSYCTYHILLACCNDGTMVPQY